MKFFKSAILIFLALCVIFSLSACSLSLEDLPFSDVIERVFFQKAPDVQDPPQDDPVPVVIPGNPVVTDPLPVDPVQDASSYEIRLAENDRQPENDASPAEVK